MKKIGTPVASLILGMIIVAMVFMWRQQANIASMPQLKAQFMTLRVAAVFLVMLLGLLAVLGPRWMALPFAFVLHYSFAMPLFAFSGKSPFFWSIPHMRFVPRTVGEYVTGMIVLDNEILWHRFGFAGIVAVLAATGLCLMNEHIDRKLKTRGQQRGGT